jgi:AraC family transcriptional regulator
MELSGTPDDGMSPPIVLSRQKPDRLMFGASLADVFSTPAYNCRVVGANQKPEFAVTRLCSSPREMEKAPEYPPDQAILICVALTPAAIGQWQAIYNGQRVGVSRAIPFATTFIDLNCRMEMWVRGPFDYLHYYLSRELLERIALDNGVSPPFRLREAFFIEDLVVAELTKTILMPVNHGEPLDRLALDQIAMVLGAYILQSRSGARAMPAGPTRGLEAWQRLRTEEMLRANLAGNITVMELASACALSGTNFARRFRLSFDTSVHQRLIQLRIDHAKQLLLRTSNSFAEVALLSGFCDQAAFSRTFRRVEKMTPSRWRHLSGGRTPVRIDNAGTIGKDTFRHSVYRLGEGSL